MLFNLDILTIGNRFRSNLSAIDNSFYRPDSQYGKSQYVKNCNLTQVEDAVKMDIKIEWNSNDDD